jgi:hypothetical protein
MAMAFTPAIATALVIWSTVNFNALPAPAAIE